MMRSGLVLALALCVAVAGCGEKGNSKRLVLAGSTAFSATAEKLSKAYIAKNPDVKIDVQSNGSQVGINSAANGSADIGMADLVKLPPEAASLKSFEVAADGIAVVVHPSNPVKDLSLEQIAAIFKGELANWKDVGGPDHAITVTTREEGSGTRKSFDKLVKIEKVAKTANTFSSNGACREAVASDPFGISYVSIGLLNDKVRGVKISGVEPTNENVLKKAYPISRPVFFLTKGDPTELKKAFIDFVLSPEGQKIIADDGLIPVTPAK